MYQYSYNFLFGTFQSLYKHEQKQVNKLWIDKLCLNFEKFTFSSLPTQAAFISGYFVHTWDIKGFNSQMEFEYRAEV